METGEENRRLWKNPCKPSREAGLGRWSEGSHCKTTVTSSWSVVPFWKLMLKRSDGKSKNRVSPGITRWIWKGCYCCRPRMPVALRSRPLLYFTSSGLINPTPSCARKRKSNLGAELVAQIRRIHKDSGRFEEEGQRVKIAKIELYQTVSSVRAKFCHRRHSNRIERSPCWSCFSLYRFN